MMMECMHDNDVLALAIHDSFLWNSIVCAYLNASLEKAVDILNPKFYPYRSITSRDIAKKRKF